MQKKRLFSPSMTTKRPGANVLHGVPLVQLHFQTVDEGAVDDHADAPSALLHVVHVLAFNPSGQSWILRRMEESNS